MIEDLHTLGEALFRDEPPLGIDASRAVLGATAVRRTRRRLAGAGAAVVAVGGALVAVAALHPAAGQDRLSPPAAPPVATPAPPVPTRLDVPTGPSAATARRYEGLLRRQVQLAGRSVSKVWWYTGDGLTADRRAGEYLPGVPARISLSLDGGNGWVALAAGAHSDLVTVKDICAQHPGCRVSTVSPGVQRVEVDATTAPRDVGGAPELESSVTLLYPDGRYVCALADSSHLLDPQPAGPYGGGLVNDGTDASQGGADPAHAVPPALSVQQLRGLAEAAEPLVAAAPAVPHPPPWEGYTTSGVTGTRIGPGTGAVLSTTTQVLGRPDASGRRTLTTTVVDAQGRKTVTTSTVGP